MLLVPRRGGTRTHARLLQLLPVRWVLITWPREGRRRATSAQLRNISALLGRRDDSFMSVSEQEQRRRRGLGGGRGRGGLSGGDADLRSQDLYLLLLILLFSILFVLLLRLFRLLFLQFLLLLIFHLPLLFPQLLRATLHRHRRITPGCVSAFSHTKGDLVHGEAAARRPKLTFQLGSGGQRIYKKTSAENTSYRADRSPASEGTLLCVSAAPGFSPVKTARKLKTARFKTKEKQRNKREHVWAYSG